MSDHFTAAAGAAGTLQGSEGLAVNIIDGVATLAGAGLAAGILVKAAEYNGGPVTICVGGICQARVGSAIDATNGAVLLQSVADSYLEVAVDGTYYIARYLGVVDSEDGDWVYVMVGSGYLETT